MKQITEKEWKETPKGYKSIINGQKYKLFLHPVKGTILAPVEIMKCKDCFHYELCKKTICGNLTKCEAYAQRDLVYTGKIPIDEVIPF
jgi:hypothetical protein